MMKNEELLIKIEELEEENKMLREKLKKSKDHRIIKTTKEEIINYWIKRQDECGLSIDWSDGLERCWRCGYKANLQRCHIIPDSLGGKDEPANFVLLCSRCHIDAPNVESKTFMWDWIRSNGTPLYDTFWKIRAQKEYEFVYGKSFQQELIDRDILSYYDLTIFWSLKIGRSIHHFAHPWNNESTDAGLLRMRLEEFDRKHPKIRKKSSSFRINENEFNSFMFEAYTVAKKYHWNIWEGNSRSRLSVAFSFIFNGEIKNCISIKLCNNGIYKACFTHEINPNYTRIKEYTIELGTRDKAIEFLTKQMEEYTQNYELIEKEIFVFACNPFLN